MNTTTKQITDTLADKVVETSGTDMANAESENEESETATILSTIKDSVKTTWFKKRLFPNGIVRSSSRIGYNSYNEGISTPSIDTLQAALQDLQAYEKDLYSTDKLQLQRTLYNKLVYLGFRLKNLVPEEDLTEPQSRLLKRLHLLIKNQTNSGASELYHSTFKKLTDFYQLSIKLLKSTNNTIKATGANLQEYLEQNENEILAIANSKQSFNDKAMQISKILRIITDKIDQSNLYLLAETNQIINNESTTPDAFNVPLSETIPFGRFSAFGNRNDITYTDNEKTDYYIDMTNMGFARELYDFIVNRVIKDTLLFAGEFIRSVLDAIVTIVTNPFSMDAVMALLEVTNALFNLITHVVYILAYTLSSAVFLLFVTDSVPVADVANLQSTSSYPLIPAEFTEDPTTLLGKIAGQTVLRDIDDLNSESSSLIA